MCYKLVVTAALLWFMHTPSILEDFDSGRLVIWGQADGSPPSQSNIASVSGGEKHGIALMADGTVKTWADPEYDKERNLTSIPNTVSNGSALLVAAGGNVSAVVMSSGLIVAWGDDRYGLVSVLNGQSVSNIRELQIGRYHAMALLQNGTLKGFGSPLGTVFGHLNIPPSAQSNVTALAVGAAHNLAIVGPQNQVIAWGRNDEGEINIPPTAATGAIGVAAGLFHSVIIQADTTVVAFGDNTQFQLGVPASLSGVTRVACGRSYTFALTNKGTVVPFGNVPAPPASSDANLNIFDIGPGDFTGYAIQGVLQAPAPPPAPPIPPPPPLPPATHPAPMPTSVLPLNISSTDNHSPTLSTGAIAGIAVGSALTLIAIVLAVVRRCVPTPCKDTQIKSEDPSPDGVVHIDIRPPEAAIMDAAMDIPGLAKGEVFTRTTAHFYHWSPISPEKQQDMVAVQAGITDVALVDDVSTNNYTSAAISLSKQELQQQIQLLTHGLLGRGAAGLVFKCLWPSRFGPNALLAAKVMKDGLESDPGVLQSFSYEASVLASLQPPHPNVVRLYGYCLEPPTMCLILELLPCSLKEVLYKKVTFNPWQSSTLTVSSTLPPSSDTQLEASQTQSQTQTQQRSTAYLTSSSSEATTSTAYVTVNTVPQSDSMLPMPSKMHSRMSTLTVRQVLQISIDIAAGLKYLHEKPVAPELKLAAGAVVNLEALEEQEATSTAPDAAHGCTMPNRKKDKIVHRDLKPANILLNSAGQAKISDFGLARPQQGTTLVTEHVGAGTLPYMAPELLAGTRVGVAFAVPASNRVDVYSTAMIMWEMLAGCMPWSNLNDGALVASVLAGRRPQLPFPSDSKDMVSSSVLQQSPTLNALPEFNAIIRACWQHKEQRRPTAEALHGMLIALLAKIEKDCSL